VWRSRRVLVTGGLSFIGSHLVDTLLEKGAEVLVADDFSSGSMANLEYNLKKTTDSTWSAGPSDLKSVREISRIEDSPIRLSKTVTRSST
jgi:nucleoside-diphosphate-sugar epimerase